MIIDDPAQKEKLRQAEIKRQLLKKVVLTNISVVIQGKAFGVPGEPYDQQLTQQCIDSIRNLIPLAEIILSTWKGSFVDHFDVDKIILNDDPGAVTYSDLAPNFFNNNNRQIVSTYNGLKAATKKYAIKMRGDCKLMDTDFTDHLKESPRSEKFKYFKQRIVIPTKYTRNPRRIAQLIHPSDIFQVGLREDLLNLWGIPLQPEPETTRAVPAHKNIFNNALTGGFHRMKFGAEQYNWYAFCKKQGLDLELKHYSHLPVSIIVDSEWSLINNFVIEDAYSLGVILPKRMYIATDKNLYTHHEWFKLSCKYSQGISIAFKWRFIFQVYLSNISRIAWRIGHRMSKYGIKDLFKTLKKYIAGVKPNINLNEKRIYTGSR
jgi:hypothetical protein